jgi:hypothetical protein
MSANSDDRDLGNIIDLVNHAHGLIAEFATLPETDRNRAAELLAQLQSVINEFRRRRPAPTFRIPRRHRLDSTSDSQPVFDHDAGAAIPVRRFKGHIFAPTVGRGIFRCERCNMVASRGRQNNSDVWRFSGESFYLVISGSEDPEDSPATPPCRGE